MEESKSKEPVINPSLDELKKKNKAGLETRLEKALGQLTNHHTPARICFSPRVNPYETQGADSATPKGKQKGQRVGNFCYSYRHFFPSLVITTIAKLRGEALRHANIRNCT